MRDRFEPQHARGGSFATAGGADGEAQAAGHEVAGPDLVEWCVEVDRHSFYLSSHVALGQHRNGSRHPGIFRGDYITDLDDRFLVEGVNPPPGYRTRAVTSNTKG